MDTKAVLDKNEVAKQLIRDCIGKRGLWAGPIRYQDQCWTRDFAIAGVDALFRIERPDVVRTHLEWLCRKQRVSGQIPILYIDNMTRWLGGKIVKTMRTLKTSFMLARWFIGVTGLRQGVSVEMLTPWTKDSEILFVLGLLEYTRRTGDTAFLESHRKHLDRALSYIENTLMKNGLVCGGDWRDTMEHLGGKALLTNNSLLYRVYVLLGDAEKAENLKRIINTEFWNNSFYRDYIGIDEFDTLGQSFAILFDVVPEERYATIIKKFADVRVRYGYKTNDVLPAPTSKQEARVIENTNQYSVMWPFVSGFAMLAFGKMGMKEQAVREFLQWTSLPGFYEWYDPKIGKGYGDPQQMWSAALYLRCAAEFYGYE